MTAPSGASHLSLPRWAYVPGESQKSSADYETLVQITVLVPPRFGGYVPVATALPIVFRSRRWQLSSRPNWPGPQLAKADLVTFAAAGRT
jgi:hypothetical protein